MVRNISRNGFDVLRSREHALAFHRISSLNGYANRMIGFDLLPPLLPRQRPGAGRRLGGLGSSAAGPGLSRLLHSGYQAGRLVGGAPQTAAGWTGGASPVA